MFGKTKKRIEELERQLRVLQFKEKNGKDLFDVSVQSEEIFRGYYHYCIEINKLSHNENGEIDIIHFVIPIGNLLHSPEVVKRDDYLFVMQRDRLSYAFWIRDNDYSEIPVSLGKLFLEKEASVSHNNRIFTY